MQEFRNLTDLRSSSVGYTGVKSTKTLDEAYDFVQSEMQQSEEVKLRENGKVKLNVVKDKA